MSDEITSRVSVLEVQMENTEKAIEKLDTTTSETYKATLSIKERLDKWNGTLPHILEAVKELQNSNKETNEKLTHNAIQDANTQSKTKVMWAIFGFLGTAIGGIILKLVFKL
jgi:uncharacterized protein YoxC